MGIMNIGSLLAMTPPENPGIVAQFIEVLFGWIGNYGWTVVVFTLILKLVLSPLDFWQKHVMHKNMRAMEKMKPQIEKLQKQYAGNKQRFQQEQMKLYKKEGYSMLGSCLPMLITIVVFFFVFSQFNGMATYMVKSDVYDMYHVYDTAYDDVYDDVYADVYADYIVSSEYEVYYNEKYASLIGGGISIEEAEEQARAYANKIAEGVAHVAAHEPAVPAGQDAVVKWYEEEGKDSFLWIKNVFVADNWSSAIPSYDELISSGLGGLRIDKNYVSDDIYTTMTAKLRQLPQNQGWNGYLIFPVLTIAISFLAQLVQKQQMPASAPGGDDQAVKKSQGIVMKVMMPVMMGFFALFYSSAFTIYMFVSQLFSFLFQAGYNFIVGRKDKKEDEFKLKHTYK